MKHFLRCAILLSVFATLSAAKAKVPTPSAASTRATQNGVLNVRDFGARGDGKTDDTRAFQKALDAARRETKTVLAPAARYFFAGRLRVPEGVTLRGSWNAAPSRESGTVLLTVQSAGKEDGAPFITLEGAAAIEGLVISYPKQNAAPPIPYPWTIRGLAQDCRVENLLLIRPYQAIDFGTFPCSRHIVKNVFGSPLRRGLFIDGSVDVGRVSNVHFTTFGFEYQGAMDKWKLQNGEAFIIGKADWEWFDGCFALGYGVGFRFIEGKSGNGKRSGVANYVAIARSGIDESGTPMIVENCGGITVSQSVFKGSAIQIRATNVAPVRFSQCAFSPMPGTASLVEANGSGRVSFTDCHFEFWDTAAVFAPALRANCVSLSVQGCEFGTDNRPTFFIGGKQKTQIEIGEKVRSAVVGGNRFRYGQTVKNDSRGDVQIVSNITDDFDLPQFSAP